MRLRALPLVVVLLLHVAGCASTDRASGDIETADTQVLATVAVGTAVYYAGFELLVDEAVHRPGRVTLTVEATNRGPLSTTPPLKVSLDDGSDLIDMEIDLSRVPAVAPASTVEVVYVFRVPNDYELATAVLRVGAAETSGATVPLGSRGALVTNGPITGFLTGSLEVADSVLTFTSSELRFDDVRRYRQLDPAQALLRIELDLTNENVVEPASFGLENVELRAPDGQALTPRSVTATQVLPGMTAEGLSAEWLVPRQPGTWTFVGLRRVGGSLSDEAITFVVPPLP